MSFLRELTAEQLVERAVRNVMPRTLGGNEIRWSAISDAFGLGSTYSIELCKKFGLDPEEYIRCPTCSECERLAAEETELR